jgi:hypothetical protein
MARAKALVPDQDITRAILDLRGQNIKYRPYAFPRAVEMSV